MAESGNQEWTALPLLLTADETASLLRTTRKAVYAMAERRRLPGVVRVHRRLLVQRDDLLYWLRQKTTRIAEGERR
jgi:excisionase family DNA binding protein